MELCNMDHLDHLHHPYNQQVPPEIIESLERYVNDKLQTGSFLHAVLENNLTEALGRADHKNIVCIWAIMNYVYNELPSVCWGNPDKVKAWLLRL